MPIDIQDYIRASKPRNVLDVVPREILSNSIAGYSHLIFSGTAVFYKNCEGYPSKDEDIENITAGGMASQWYHPFCKYYREDCGRDKACQVFDRVIVHKYCADPNKGPMLYRCHRQMWDMTYPLRVGANFLGVLFAGQIIVDEENNDWRKGLSEVEKYVDWGSFDEKRESQGQDILDALGEGEVTNEQLSKIEEIINAAKKKERPARVPAVELMRRFKDFLEFGRVTVGLLEEFYNLKVHAAEQGLLRQMATELTKATSDAEQWWRVLAELIKNFGEATGVRGIDVYARVQTSYVRQIAYSQRVSREDGKKIPVSLCIELLVEKLVHAEDGRLRKHIGVSGKAYLYRYDLAVPEGQNTSTIIVVRGEITVKELEDFVEEFCAMVGLRADVSIIQHQIEEDRMEYKKRVWRISHAVKTPLQVCLNEARRALKSLNSIILPDENSRRLRADSADHIKVIRENITRTRTEMLGLHARVDLPRKRIDLREVLRDLAKEMEPLAAGKDCRIELDAGTAPIVCKIQRDEVRMAIRNLIDNAVKFSFHKHEIRISARETASQTVVIGISNYGVGIPEDKKEAIKELGERGGVVDRERPAEKRAGTGLGLSIAMDIIRRHDGWINIESNPAGTYWAPEYMCYITKVEVTLPLYVDAR
jgi:signal transduction histidine kinase